MPILETIKFAKAKNWSVWIYLPFYITIVFIKYILNLFSLRFSQNIYKKIKQIFSPTNQHVFVLILFSDAHFFLRKPLGSFYAFIATASEFSCASHGVFLSKLHLTFNIMIRRGDNTTWCVCFQIAHRVFITKINRDIETRILHYFLCVVQSLKFSQIARNTFWIAHIMLSLFLSNQLTREQMCESPWEIIC